MYVDTALRNNVIGREQVSIVDLKTQIVVLPRVLNRVNHSVVEGALPICAPIVCVGLLGILPRVKEGSNVDIREALRVIAGHIDRVKNADSYLKLLQRLRLYVPHGYLIERDARGVYLDPESHCPLPNTAAGVVE